MEREYSNDQVDAGIGHFLSLSAAALAAACEWILEADRGQLFLADGARNLPEWVSARFGLRHSTAAQLVRVARRLEDLPLLREKFAAGELSLDQTDSISKLATADTEEAVIAECLGLSNAALDRAARRANPPTSEDAVDSWRERWLSIQYTLDGIRGRLNADLPGMEMSLVESAIREKADRIPINPESGIFDPYPQRMADGLLELCATTGGANRFRTDSAHGSRRSRSIDLGSSHDRGGRDSGRSGRSPTRPPADCPVIRSWNVRSTTTGKCWGSAVVLGSIPAWLRHQLWFRDGSCRFPGCPSRRFAACPPQDTLGRWRTNRSGQSDPPLWLSPPVPT